MIFSIFRQQAISPLLSVSLTLILTFSIRSQVHYLGNGSLWNRKAEAGPDAEVRGWYYNLGTTGIRVRLITEAPKPLVLGLGGSKAQIYPLYVLVIILLDYLILIDAQAIASLAEAPTASVFSFNPLSSACVSTAL